MKFTIDSQPAADRPRPKMVDKAMALLAALEDGKLLTTLNLAGRLAVSRRSFIEYVSHPDLAAHRHRTNHGVAVLWGNKATIAAWVKHEKEIRRS